MMYTSSYQAICPPDDRQAASESAAWRLLGTWAKDFAASPEKLIEFADGTDMAADVLPILARYATRLIQARTDEDRVAARKAFINEFNGSDELFCAAACEVEE